MANFVHSLFYNVIFLSICYNLDYMEIQFLAKCYMPNVELQELSTIKLQKKKKNLKFKFWQMLCAICRIDATNCLQFFSEKASVPQITY